MRMEKTRRVVSGIAGFGTMTLWLLACCFGANARAQVAAPAVIAVQPQPDPLVWDAVQKEVTPKPGDEKAEFTFTATNTSSAPVTITHVQPSCGCTIAKLPSEPWVIGPGSNGTMEVSIDLIGKSGELYKTLNVYGSNIATRTLVIVVHMPLSPEMLRAQNQMAAMADRQAVFKGTCAECHVDKGRGKSGKALYAEDCGICHDATHRATMVPDLKALKHPTDEAYWRQWIRSGKQGTLMPAFASDQGGPRTDQEVDDLVKVLTKVFPSSPATNAMSQVATPVPIGITPK